MQQRTHQVTNQQAIGDHSSVAAANKFSIVDQTAEVKLKTTARNDKLSKVNKQFRSNFEFQSCYFFFKTAKKRKHETYSAATPPTPTSSTSSSTLKNNVGNQKAHSKRRNTICSTSCLIPNLLNSPREEDKELFPRSDFLTDFMDENMDQFFSTPTYDSSSVMSGVDSMGGSRPIHVDRGNMMQQRNCFSFDSSMVDGQDTSDFFTRLMSHHQRSSLVESSSSVTYVPEQCNPVEHDATIHARRASIGVSLEPVRKSLHGQSKSKRLTLYDSLQGLGTFSLSKASPVTSISTAPVSDEQVNESLTPMSTSPMEYPSFQSPVFYNSQEQVEIPQTPENSMFFLDWDADSSIESLLKQKQTGGSSQVRDDENDDEFLSLFK